MTKPIRVLLLSQWFDPEPTFKGLVFARELVRQGFEVEVVTGFPNYPGGKVYPGYKIRWLQRELIDGVRITRVPLFPSHDQSATKRILNYLSFAFSALIYGLFMVRRVDLIYAYHPPLTVGITASILRLIRRIPVVYDIQDMWPDTLRATGMLNNALALSVVGVVCNWVYLIVDHIVVLSPGFNRLLLKRGVPKAKLSVIYNWADEFSLKAKMGDLHSTFPESEKFRILFAGNMGKAQALETVLQAAEFLQQKCSRVCWVLIGGGVELDYLKAETRRRHLHNVVFLPAVSMSEIGGYLLAADALLVHLRKDPLFEITIPSKTQAYMAVGKPLIMAVQGDAAELVQQSGGGLIVESENPQALAHAAETMANTSNDALAMMGQHAQVYYQQHLALTVGVQRFGELFKQITR